MRRRLLFLAILAVASATGTGGFSTAEMDRGVSVSVVSDDKAMIGIKTHDQNLAPGQTHDVVLLTVINRLGQNRINDIAVDVDEPKEEPDPPKVKQVLEPRNNDRIWKIPARVVCGSGMSETWTVDLTVKAEGVTAELSRHVDVRCASPGNSE